MSVEVRLIFSSLDEMRSEMFGSLGVVLPQATPPSVVETASESTVEPAADSSTPESSTVDPAADEPKKKRKRRTKAEIEADKAAESDSPKTEVVEASVTTPEDKLLELRTALSKAVDRTGMNDVLGLMEAMFGVGVTRAAQVPADRIDETIEAANKLGV